MTDFSNNPLRRADGEALRQGKEVALLNVRELAVD